MKKLLGTLLLLSLVVLVYAQDSTGVGGGVDAGIGLVAKISIGLNAVLAVLSGIFKVKLNGALGKAGSALGVAQAKATQAISLASKAIAALEDGNVSEAEIEDLKAAYKILKG